MSFVRFAAPKLPTILGLILISLGILILLRLFWNPVKQEVDYLIHQYPSTSPKTAVPVNTNFALMIPKINANAPVVENVSPTNSNIYQRALTKGIAHAEGTGMPGEGQNIFMFAHSSANILTASQYNSVFYLVHHLELGDQIIVWYQDREYQYHVVSTKIVPATQVSYLTQKPDSETLTLMTCWPPGTTYQRLLVTAKRSL